jgi:mRNA-degrading endonuclease RelE of RelBE toxin-antitoxin system
VFLPLCRARERLDFPIRDYLFEIQWRESTKKDLRAIPAHEVERIVAAVEKLSDEPFPYGFQKLTGAAHTPHKNGAKRKLTEIRLAGLLEHRGASQQTKRRKIPAKEEAFHRRNT